MMPGSGLPNPTLARALLLSATLAVPGCWAPPRSNVQPPGEPRVIAAHIRVQSHEDPAVVQAVDAQARTVSLMSTSRRSLGVYSVSPYVSGLGEVKPGERIRAILVDELSVYVLHAGEPASIAGERIEAEARVLSVDPSYRLLVVQYPDGEQETFKPGPDVNLRTMQAGDAVVIRPVELVALKPRK
jgi:hypothetical protein